jgi:membrane protein implicated in regulation of membrane protease activity
MRNAAAAPWVRLGFLGVLALILGLNPSMPLPLKLAALSILALNLAMTLLKWRAARRRRAEQHATQDDIERS